MVEAWTAAQIREAERPHLEAGEPLMRRAADGLAEAVSDLLRASSGSRDGRAARVLVLVGSGNNGGDALYAGESLARDVVPRGGTITVVPVGSRVHEAALAAALDAGATLDSVGRWCDPAGVAGRLPGYDVVLDGLVGTGSSGTGLRGDALRVVRAMLPVFEQARAGDRDAHRAGAESGHVARSDADSDVTGVTGGVSRVPVVVAVDVPSGIGVDDGTVPDPPVVLSADVTVTFGGRKVGLLVGPGSRVAGRVLLVDIGIGPDLARMTPFDADPAA